MGMAHHKLECGMELKPLVKVCMGLNCLKPLMHGLSHNSLLMMLLQTYWLLF